MGNTTIKTIDEQAVQQFITFWSKVKGSELATAQSFVSGLCALLNMPPPTHEPDYMFERPITFSHGDGSSSAGRIDCYRRGHFVLEAKKLKNNAPTKGFDDALLRARTQAEGYARALPAAEGRPPFVLVVDVGNVIELYAEFSRSGATYTPFPDPRSHRIKLADLAKPEVQDSLRRIWLDPDSLDPARASARVTRAVSNQLAELAKSLEGSGHRADHVAAFLTRCLFSMFAEDVELLPKGSFLNLLQNWREQPATLQQMLRILWADMDHGGFSAALAAPVLHFNGKLFKEAASDGYSLLLTTAQIDQLIAAARANWREVEPAIFGTLLERALDPTERHALGAHYTPRAYVERLVLPAVVEPLRAEWANALAASIVLAQEAMAMEASPVIMTANTPANIRAVDRFEATVRAKWHEARQQIKDFHHQLCNTRVLDPACGSGNFLYVTLEHLKRLEGEVFNQLEALGESQDSLSIGVETVTLEQLRGIEINERAAAMAELVLWIGYLQWHIRTRGNKAVAEPVVHNYGNIECRDAVLAWDGLEPAHDAHGALLTRWDGKTRKPHPVTGKAVPDESAQVPQWRYLGARKAAWPDADFIVGNPPFLGAGKDMRLALGDGYVETIRNTWPEVPESVDFVMYWWAHAAALVAQGKVHRFGLITTNSLRQTFNRRVVQAALTGTAVPPSFAQEKLATTSGGVGAGQKSPPTHARPDADTAGLVLTFAIPDHPWVDSADGAAVRVAMTVAKRGSDPDFAQQNSGSDPLFAGSGTGRLLTVTDEQTGEFGEVSVTLTEKTGLVNADLSVGTDITNAQALLACQDLSNRGVQLFGAGFIVTPEQAAAMGYGTTPGLERVIRDYRNGRDLTDAPRGVRVIDAFGLSAEQLRSQFPAVYQWLLEHVKPERDQNNRATYRDNWWIHGEPRKVLRKQLAGLPRYIATVETAKHRTFQFLDASILPDNKLIAIALADAFHLGVLSSRAHISWALAAGSTLEDRPVYVKTTCFETFPFPAEDTGLTPALRDRIASLAEQIDHHRKKVLGLLPSTANHAQAPDTPGRGLPGADFWACDSMR
ncbi:MAG: DNA methyltransferase, partial [Rhodoferax sp.]|uniref:class I SAM-dependent DNA methyltransferase n=1 Tax=Rhodoferax sp. TaxID=50421 RepID=UPI003C742E76